MYDEIIKYDALLQIKYVYVSVYVEKFALGAPAPAITYEKLLIIMPQCFSVTL